MITNQLFNPQIVSQNNNFGKKEKKICCLYPHRVFVCYDLIRKLPVPLKEVHYFLKVNPGFLIVELQQTYSTQGYNEPIELEYLFSINKNAAVTKMIVELGDSKVYGIVKEKEEAKKEYEEGLKQGKTMAYSEKDEEFPEINRVKIGALAPNKQLKITFEYIQPLEVFLNKFWKVEVYPMIDKNYFSQEQQQRTKNIYYERLNRYVQQYVLIEKFEFNFKQNISVLIDIGTAITYYKCPTHSILSGNAKNEYAKQTLELEEINPKKLNLMLEDTPSNFNPTKQFTLLLSSDDINLPRAFLSHTNIDALFTQKYCATLTFIPKFNQITLDDAYSQYLEGYNRADDQVINRGNYVFFIDRSGSMSGKRIEKAKQSLILFLKSLPEDCTFNIISFGTTFRSLWTDSKKYSQDTLEEALKHVQNMSANMQGTEILRPLQEVIYNKFQGKSTNTTLNIFLLTDGEVDAPPIIELVKQKNKAETRVYTIGIGEGCSQYLIKRLAEVGNGKYQFVSDDEDINAKVIDLLEDSLTPYLNAFNLECNVNSIAQIIPNPESIVCLKKNQELTIQILFSIDQQNDDLQFTLSCFDPQDQKPIKYTVSLNLKNSQENEYFHKLAAYKLITFYENSLNYGDNNLNFIKIDKQTIDEQDIINTSITHQILSTKTAFVCEVCELEDQFKQQMRQKLYITSNKHNNEEDHINLMVNPYNCSGGMKRAKCQMSRQIKYEKPMSQLNYRGTDVKMKNLEANQGNLRLKKQEKEQVIQEVFRLRKQKEEQILQEEFILRKQEEELILQEEFRLRKQEEEQKLLRQKLSSRGQQKNQILQEKQMKELILREKEKLRREVEELEQEKKERSRDRDRQKKCLFEDEDEDEDEEFVENKLIQSKAQQQKIQFNQIEYEALIQFAQANGCFLYDEKIEQQINVEGWKNEQNYPQNLWLTLIVLLYLDKFCSQNKQSWQLIHKKGVQFLQKNGLNYKQLKEQYLNKNLEQI